MLQISLIHELGGLKIRDAKDCTTLTTFDDAKGYIDLGPIQPYVGQRFCLIHYDKHGDETVFVHKEHKLLAAVDKDSNGIWFLEYQ